MTVKEQQEALSHIDMLLRELSNAYYGILTLPADHPARIAYLKAAQFWEVRV